MILSKATNIANRIVEVLQPHCTLIHIAGSVRREKPEVKDIEVCCIPHYQQGGLFADIRIVSKKFKEAAIEIFVDEIEKGDWEGRYMKIKLKGTDIRLDLFLPDPDDYYRQFAIRTGSGMYSQKVIAAGWLKVGWCGVADVGLRVQEDCEQVDGYEGKKVWKLVNDSGTRPPVWKSEEEFFEFIRTPWIEPKLRSI